VSWNVRFSIVFLNAVLDFFQGHLNDNLQLWALALVGCKNTPGNSNSLPGLRTTDTLISSFVSAVLGPALNFYGNSEITT
jgi:hypothetical protein